MSEFNVGKGPFFHRGIDTITFKHDAGNEGLPAMQKLVPSEEGARPQLERLLNRPTLNGYLDQAIRPQVLNRELLMPHQFRATLKSALTTLRKRQEKQRDPKSREARVLARAARLLAEEDELRDLAQMYCSTLIPG